jgi:ribonuclease III
MWARRSELERRIGFTFKDRRLFDLAMTHRSFAYEHGNLPNNERLEFLGDSVLGIVVTRALYDRFPHEAEGDLAKRRAALVNANVLAEVAREIGLGSAIRLGRGEELTGGADKSSILADTFEALLGAVYLDRGMRRARKLILALMTSRITGEVAVARDWKTALQELCSAKFGELPEYRVSESGPDHQKRFRALVILHGTEYGSGEGRSKKEAEQQAAKIAVGRLGQEDGARAS